MRRPRGPHRGDPLFDQGRAAVHFEELGQRDVHPDLHGLPGPLRQQVRSQEPPHGFLQRVVVALLMRPGVLRPRRRRQGVQHRADQRRALRGQVTAQHPRTVKRGLQPHRPVLKRPARVLIRHIRAGPLIQLRRQPAQIPQVHPRPRRRHQDRVRRRLAIAGQLIGPLTDGAAERLRHLLCGQRRRHLRMGSGTPRPRGMPGRRAPGDPGLVHQPRPRAVIRIRAVPLPGGKRRQHRGPRRRAHRIGLLQHPQAPGLGLGPQLRRVRGGQPAQPRVHHLHRLTRRGRGSTHLGPPPFRGRAGWSLSLDPGVSPSSWPGQERRPGASLGFQFDSTRQLRHFRVQHAVSAVPGPSASDATTGPWLHGSPSRLTQPPSPDQPTISWICPSGSRGRTPARPESR